MFKVDGYKCDKCGVYFMYDDECDRSDALKRVLIHISRDHNTSEGITPVPHED